MSKDQKKKGSEVALKNQFSQADVPAMLEQVNAKIKELKGDENGDSARITAVLGNFGVISSITEPNILRSAYAYITSKGEANEKYSAVFQKEVPTVKLPSFTEGGYSVAAWQKEILTQFRHSTYKEQLDKMLKVKAKLESLLSEEHKVAAALNDIADLLTN